MSCHEILCPFVTLRLEIGMPQKNSHPMNNKVPHGMYYVAIVCPDNLNNKIKGFKLWMQEKLGCKVA
jgi:hypothetical protein